MKRNTEKQYDPPMQFFSRELFLRVNSFDEAEMDRADDDWEAALEAYERHLKSMSDFMPDDVRQLVDMNFHDYELLNFRETLVQSRNGTRETANKRAANIGTARLLLEEERQRELVELSFSLWDRVRTSRASSKRPFSKRQRLWLYEELHAFTGDSARFYYRILFGDGSVMEIPFLNVEVGRYPKQPVEVNGHRDESRHLSTSGPGDARIAP